jgi:hypothetical protein
VLFPVEDTVDDIVFLEARLVIRVICEVHGATRAWHFDLVVVYFNYQVPLSAPV